MVSDDLSTSLPGVFACGNVLHVHDLVDFVSQEAAKAGENAAHYILSGQGETATVRLEGKNGVRYTVPQQLDPHHMADSVTRALPGGATVRRRPCASIPTVSSCAGT